MLEYRYVPLRELLEMKHSHHIVMEAMAAHGKLQPGDDHVWPGLRTLSKITKYSINTVRKAISEMETLGHLTVIRGRRGSANRYLIEARFLRAVGADPKPVALNDDCAPPPQAALPQGDDQEREIDDRQIAFDFSGAAAGVYQPLTKAVSIADTEEEKEEFKSLTKNEAIPLGRDAPPKEPTAAAPLSSDQAKEIKELKAENWRNKVVRFVQHRYSGGELQLRLLGLMGEDPIVDAKRWYKICEEERVAADWDDMRDRRKTRRLTGLRTAAA